MGMRNCLLRCFLFCRCTRGVFGVKGAERAGARHCGGSWTARCSTVKSRDGEMVKLKLADEHRWIVAMVPASLTDIKPNSFVGTTAMPDANGHWQSRRVHIFSGGPARHR